VLCRPILSSLEIKANIQRIYDRILSWSYVQRIPFSTAIVEDNPFGFLPHFLVHEAIKGNEFLGTYLLFAVWDKCIKSPYSLGRLKIKVTRHDDLAITLVLDVDFEILIPGPYTATGLETQDILGRRIHDGFDLEHA
jgi:hypothetical protein